MTSTRLTFLLLLTFIVISTGCRSLLDDNANILEPDNVKSVMIKGGDIQSHTPSALSGFLIHSENLKTKTVELSKYEGKKTQQIYKYFQFINGFGESIEISTKRPTEVLNPIESLKKFSKNWKHIQRHKFIWGKNRFYDSKYMPIRYRAAKIENSDEKCIFFSASGASSKKDHFGRSGKYIIGYYCLNNPSINIEFVEKVFDGFSIDGEALIHRLFDAGDRDIPGLIYYQNNVKILYNNFLSNSYFPLNISDRIENRGSLLSD